MIWLYFSSDLNPIENVLSGLAEKGQNINTSVLQK